MALPPRRPFKIPDTVTIIFRAETNGHTSAHALEFDLVSTAPNQEDALKKVRTAIVSYIETGLLNEWAEDIRYPAPEQYWPAKGAKLDVGEPIYIMSRSLLVYSASSVANEHREAHSLA
jgi:hypothetical protein